MKHSVKLLQNLIHMDRDQAPILLKKPIQNSYLTHQNYSTSSHHYLSSKLALTDNLLTMYTRYLFTAQLLQVGSTVHRRRWHEGGRFTHLVTIRVGFISKIFWDWKSIYSVRSCTEQKHFTSHLYLISLHLSKSIQTPQ